MTRDRRSFLLRFGATLTMGVSATIVASCSVTTTRQAEIYTSLRNDLAVGGFDVVSFFSGNPQRGRTEFRTLYKGATWRFATQANLDLFLLNPTQFEPQYGGYCAWAVARQKLAPGKPQHWHVEDGKLYLNYSARVKKRWDSLRGEFIAEADRHWPDILGG